VKTRRDPIEAEELALERDFRAFWARTLGQSPARSQQDLILLQAALDRGHLPLATDADRRSLGIALGMVLVHELRLVWIRLADEWGVEMALSRPGSEIVAHPLSMIADRADEGRPIDLGALFQSIARLFAGAPLSVRAAAAAPIPWRAEFLRPGPGLELLEHRLGILAAQLQRAADLSYVLIRGVHFSISVDVGRGNPNDLTMQVSFAGDRAMLVVGGTKADEVTRGGRRYDLHSEARRTTERLIEQHLTEYPDAAADFPPFGDEAAQERFSEAP